MGKLRNILEEFASEFAMKEEDGHWWGHDTDLGTMETVFSQTINKIYKTLLMEIPSKK